MSLPPILETSKKPGPFGGGKWFFAHNSKETGPLDFRELREAAARGDFLAEDDLWREGGERRLAGTVLGLFPRSKNPSDLREKTSAKNDNIYAPPGTQSSIMDGPPGGLYLPHLRKAYFSLLLFLVLAGAALFALGFVSDQATPRVTFIAFGVVLWAIWAFFSLIYLHRAWEMMGMLGAHLSGNKAVSWMLLPLFNAVWSFIAVVGWARLWNRNAKNHPGLSAAWRVFVPSFVLFSISLLGLQIWLIIYSFENWPLWDFQNRFVQTGYGFAAGVLFFGMLSWFHICHSINFLARKKS